VATRPACLVDQAHVWHVGPNRIGPFILEDDARQAFAAISAVLERALEDAACDSARAAGCTFAEEGF
jgi:hypothetical protein